MAGMHLVLLLLALLAFSTSAKIFLSIDCGASENYTDGNMVEWVPDDGYIKSGESKVVQSSRTLSQVIDTLRVFTTTANNCYLIKADKGENVLVRASFYYGNYDNKLVPPTFDLQLNGKYWATVVTDLTNGVYTYYEAIYVVDGGDISVCLAQTFDGQYPFISAIEVRSLDATMYSRVDANRPLYMMARIYGSPTDAAYVSYPDDIYDRIWNPTALTPTISNSLLTIDVNVEDNPPEAVLQYAVTSDGTNLPVEFSLKSELPKDEVPVYINMYFAELVQHAIDTTDKRSFHVYIDDKRISSNPIIPTYGSVQEWGYTNITASSTTVFSLRATSDSTLPPIINAFELFTYGGDSKSSSTTTNNNSGNDNNNNNNSGTGSGSGNNNNTKKSSQTSKKKKKNNLPAILGATISTFLVIWAIVGVLLVSHYKRKKSVIAKGEIEGDVMPNETPNSTQHIMDSRSQS